MRTSYVQYVVFTFRLSHSLSLSIFLSLLQAPQRSTLFPYTTLFRSRVELEVDSNAENARATECSSYISCCRALDPERGSMIRSEEHTSELQSRPHLVCRLLLEKKKQEERAYAMCLTVYKKDGPDICH